MCDSVCLCVYPTRKVERSQPGSQGALNTDREGEKKKEQGGAGCVWKWGGVR